MRTLVTGVAGFVGSRVAEEALKRGHDVLGIDSFNDYYDPRIKRRRIGRLDGQGFELVEADLLETDIQPLLSGVGAIFHQAGQPGVRQSWSDGFFDYCERNVLLTQRLLEAIRITQESGGSRPRLVFASSSSVYGDQPGIVNESTLPAPKSPYGVSKLAAEHLCSTYSRCFELDVVSLRYFTVYGGGQRPDMAIQRLIRSALTGEEFELFGTGDQVRDFTHVEDVVSANFAAIESEVASGEVFNVSGGSPVSLRMVIEMVEAITGRSINIRPTRTQAGDVAVTNGSTAKAAERLGWFPQRNLEDGLREHVEYERSGAFDQQ